MKRRRWNVEQSPPPTPAPTSPAPATPAPAAPAPASPAGPAGAGGATVLPAGVPASYPGCNNIKDYPSTPLKVEPFTEAFKQAAIKEKKGTVPGGSVPMDVYEFEEVYVANYKLLPESVCPGGTKMLLYDGVFPGKTVVQEVGHQVCLCLLRLLACLCGLHGALRVCLLALERWNVSEVPLHCVASALATELQCAGSIPLCAKPSRCNPGLCCLHACRQCRASSTRWMCPSRVPFSARQVCPSMQSVSACGSERVCAWRRCADASHRAGQLIAEFHSHLCCFSHNQ